MKKANVRNILEISNKSKWSVDDFNWDQPLSDDLDDKTNRVRAKLIKKMLSGFVEEPVV